VWLETLKFHQLLRVIDRVFQIGLEVLIFGLDSNDLRIRTIFLILMRPDHGTLQVASNVGKLLQIESENERKFTHES
jgi:hypothetical protein